MAVTENPALLLNRAGWFTDPEALHNLRYFDGVNWTNHVTHFGPTPCQQCYTNEVRYDD